MARSVYTVSAEPSGDSLAVGLIRELRMRVPSIELHAIGGSDVQAEGFTSIIDTSPLSVLGFVEGIRALPTVRRLVRRASEHILGVNPEAVILIDSWGFMVRLAAKLRQGGYRGHIIKYVAPQVWAMRRGRARVLARHVDCLLCLYPFDVPFFEAVGLPSTVVGTPVLDKPWAGGDGLGFRQKHGIARDVPVLMVAFGSRRSEIERLVEPFLETLRILKAEVPALEIIAPTVPNTKQMLEDRLQASGMGVRLYAEDQRDAYAAADVALLKSGTITLQASAAGLPALVGYKVHPLTFAIAKRLMKAKYITIVNVVADAPLLPEFVQDEFVPQTVAAAILPLIETPPLAEHRGEMARQATETLKNPRGANAAAAIAVMNVMGVRPSERVEIMNVHELDWLKTTYSYGGASPLAAAARTLSDYKEAFREGAQLIVASDQEQMAMPSLKVFDDWVQSKFPDLIETGLYSSG